MCVHAVTDQLGHKPTLAQLNAPGPAATVHDPARSLSASYTAPSACVAVLQALPCQTSFTSCILHAQLHSVPWLHPMYAYKGYIDTQPAAADVNKPL